MKVVVDTNVMVSALLNPPGPPGQVLNLVLSGRVTVLLDNRILSEYRDVLLRPKFSFDAAEVESLLGFLSAGGEYVLAEPNSATFRDEDDRAFYEVAVSGSASFLVTGNQTHFPSQKTIVSPAEFLRRYRSRRSRSER